MKALTCPVILTSASTRADGSLGLRFATPELKPEDKTVMFELLNLNMTMRLDHPDAVVVDLHEVKSEFEQKTPGQRLRAVLFVWWKQSQEPGEFETFYKHQMEKIIDHIKTKLQPE